METMNGTELYDYYASFNNSEMLTFSRWTPDFEIQTLTGGV